MKKNVSSLLPALESYEIYAPSPEARAMLDKPVTVLCCDSRKTHDLSLFFCLVGARSDGHRFATAAYHAGTRAFVVEHTVDLPEDALQIVVPHTRRALADATAEFYDHPEREMRIVGITGTKGKTTTALMIAGILNRCGIPAGYIGTNGIEFAGQHFPTVNSTPESVVIYHFLRRMLDEGVRTCVMEVSSQALWMHRIRGLSFHACLFTNLSRDHIGGAEHPTYEHYAACKHALFTDYPTDLVVCNVDDPAADDMMRGVTAPVIRFSTQASDPAKAGAGPADQTILWSASDIAPARQGDLLGVRYVCHVRGQESRPLFLPLPGAFNVQNALGALAICHHGFGLPVERILPCLEGISVPGRFETVTSPALPGVTFIIDYAHNGISLTSILDALRTFAPTRLICLFGSVGGRTFERRTDLALAAAHRADLCVLTSDNPGTESPLHVIREIDEAFPPDACPRLCIADRAEAVRKVVELARPGDIILLAGKGHENYQLIGTQAVPYSDRQTLEEALRALDGAHV